MLVKCPNCGRDVEWDAPICTHCGATKSTRQQIDFTKIIVGGILVFLFAGWILISYTYNFLAETFNQIERREEIWCGYYYAGYIRLYKDDIAKKGSSICLKYNSWRESKKIYVNFPKNFDSDEYEENIIVIKGAIENNELNVQSIKKYE